MRSIFLLIAIIFIQIQSGETILANDCVFMPKFRSLPFQ